MKGFGLLPFLLIGNILVCIVSIPMLLTWSHTPSDAVYTWVHGTPIDYYQYLSVIKEGMNGSWRTTDLYTTEPTQQSLVFIFFLIIGKIGALFRLSPITIYHFARIGAIEFMLLMMYRVCSEVVGKTHAFWAATVGLFSTVPPLMYIGSLQATLGDIAWWDVLDSLHRADYLPHHAFGMALLFTSVFFIIRFMKKRKIYQFATAFIVSFITGLVYPTPALLLVVAPILTSVLYVIACYRLQKTNEISRVVPIILVSIGALLSLLIMRGEIAKGFPWSGWTNGYGVWTRIGHFERNFIFAAGLPLLLAFPVVCTSLLKGKEFSTIFVSVWAFTPILLVLFSSSLGLERIRMAYMGQFAAYGILVTFSLFGILERMKTRWIKRCVIVFIAVVFVANSLLVTWHYFPERLSREPYTGENFHVPKKLFPAYAFIDRHVPRYATVFGDFIIGNTLPGFATVKTYFGHWTQTMDYWRKADEAQNILTGQYSPSKVAAVIKREKIDYIFVRTAQERKAIDPIIHTVPLQTIYTDGDIRVYKVGGNNI